MKWACIILLISTVLLNEQCVTPQAPSQSSSSIYLKYRNDFKDLYVYSVHSWGLDRFYSVIGKKKNKWHIINIYRYKTYYGEDSIVTKPCINCEEIERTLKIYDIANLPDEKDLSSPCMEKRDTIAGVLSQPRSLEHISDVGYIMLEFKTSGVERSLRYKNPYLALQICPQSEERKRYVEILEVIKSAK